MKLYGSLTSPYVRKVRILVREKNLACEFVVADAWAADSPIPALNPLGKVPVLALDNNDVLFDSPVIVEYLDSLKAPALLAVSGAARWEMLRWQALADGMLDASVSRLLESRRAAGQTDGEKTRRHGRKNRAFAQIHRGPPAQRTVARVGSFHPGRPGHGGGARIHRLSLSARLAQSPSTVGAVAGRGERAPVAHQNPAPAP